MEKENEIVSELLKENIEFRKIKELHAEYEQKLEELNKKHFLSDNEKLERKTLKKKKLAAKDKIALIIEGHKAASRG